MYHIAGCTLESTSPYSQSNALAGDDLKRSNESNEEWEERIWRKRCHVNNEGFVEIPALAVPNAIKDAAKYSGLKIPGERNATWTKHFDAGVTAIGPVALNVRIEDVIPETFFVPSDGKRGGSTRVYKTFPMIPEWKAMFDLYIFDEKIHKEIFHKMLSIAGQLIGIGRFRPRNRGYYGRFLIRDLRWEEYDV